MFSIPTKTNFDFLAKFNLSSANAFNLEQSKNLSFGKELNYLLGIDWSDQYFAHFQATTSVLSFYLTFEHG